MMKMNKNLHLIGKIQLHYHHKENNIEMPQEYINLLAKHLVVRESPKVITTTFVMETDEGISVNRRTRW